MVAQQTLHSSAEEFFYIYLLSSTMRMKTEESMNERTKEHRSLQLRTASFFRFRDFQVHKDARRFRKHVKELTKKFPKVETYGLRSQIWKALDSILLNIAERSDRYSDQDFGRFLNTAVTSTLEVISGLEAALDDKYLTQGDLSACDSQAENILKQIKAFSAKGRRDNRKKG
jgi:four helix bundle protein